jgi:Divergent InlB B-repeat domain/Bacterial Ig-like domain (group 3)/FG-GAP-like repeat/Putative Ig domain
MFCRLFMKGWLVKSGSRGWKAITGRNRALHIAIPILVMSLMTPLSQGQKGAYVAGVNYPAGPASVPSNTYFLSGGISPQQVFTANFNGKIGLVVAAKCESGYMPTCPGSGATVVYMSNGDGTFAPPIISGPSESIYTVVLGDFDNDGNLDVAAVTDCPANSQGCSGVLLSVLYGDGNGNFTQGPQYQINGAVATTRAANSLAVGDFNGDGNLDLVVGIECAGSNGCGSGAISIYPGTGDKTRTNPFGSPTSFPIAGNAPVIPVVGNFCGNGRQDVVAGGYGGLTILESEGNGAFLQLPTIPSPSSPFAVAAVDVNGDGNLDLVTTTSSASFEITTGNGNCTFNSPVVYNSSLNNLGTDATSLAIADLRGTGEADLVIGAFLAGDNAVQLFFNDGHGNFTGGPTTGGPTYGLGGWLYAPIVAQDFNGDGKVDVVMASACTENSTDEYCPEGTISVLLGNGNGTMQAARIITPPLGAQSFSTITADVNGDGIPDLIQTSSYYSSQNTGEGAVLVSLGLGNGDYGLPKSYSTGPSYARWVVAGDFNGDGKLDLAVANLNSDFGGDGGVSILLGNGDGTFGSPTVYDSGGASAMAVVTGDFNGDNKLDIAVLNSTSIGILLGNGDGTFTLKTPVLITDTTGGVTTNYSIAVGDFNHDGSPDVALLGKSPSPDSAGFYDDAVEIFISNGDGSFRQVGSTYPSGGTGYDATIAVGDVNGDGKLDIVAANTCELLDTNCAKGLLGVLLGNGDGTFQSGPLQTVPDGTFVSLLLSDVNGDGILDAIAMNLTGVAVFIGNGDGSFQAPTVYAGASIGGLSGGNQSLALADLNIIQPALQNGMNAVMVNKAGTYLVTTSSANPPSGNQAPQLTTTVTPSYLTGVSPTGSISYYDETGPAPNLLGSAPLVDATATFGLSSLNAGVHTITAFYSGDANFSAHAGTPLLQVLSTALQPPQTSPTITSASGTTFMVLAQGSFLVTTTGSPVPALAEAGLLPNGVTFTDNGDGTASLAGTPASGTAGTYSITVTASNAVGFTSQSFTLSVNMSVAITSGSGTTFTVGAPGSFTVSTVGTPTPVLTETGTLPTGVSFVDNGNGTGTLSGSPASGTMGSYAISFAANNGSSSATQNFTLTVNEGPAITSGSATTFAVGAAGSFLVTSIGVPLPALTETGSLPTGISFVDNGNGTGTLSGTPGAGSGGTYAISIAAANGVGTNATQSFTLTIDQGLAITSGSMTTFTVGATGWFSITTTGFPVPALTETGSLPDGVTFVDNGNGTATLSGTPAGYSGGSYPITIDASNGGIEPDAIQSFTLIVNQGSAIITGNSTTFTVGVSGSFTVNTTGDPVPALTEAGALPAGISFTDNGNGTGTLSGTPTAGAAGSYPITFSANNGVGTAAMQSFSLTVNQGPAITSTNSTTFTAQVAGSFTVTATGDPTPALSETGNLPTGVTFIDNGNGTATLSGTPAAGTAGQYGFTIQASNGVTPNATQSFTLTVNSLVSVTVNTNPSGLSFSVDGSTYTSSQTLTWTVGTSHTISTTSPQTPTAGTQYTFTSWSDGGELSHSVTASAGTTSYTASFSTSYQLTTATSPSGGGTVSPATGSYYASGAVVPLVATPNAGYVFSSWTGSVANASTAQTTVTMNAPESVTANFQSGAATPTINWATPAAIAYGASLTSKQLDATATYDGSSVGGTFTYTPPKGTVLDAGSQTLSVTFTPTNKTKYTTATGTVTLQVNQATPKITWARPAAITYGTALSSTQLDASSTVAGSFAYSPALGTVPTAGTQTLSVTFTPTDTTDYATATDSVTLTVDKASSTTTINANTPNPSLINEAVTVSFDVTGGGVGPTGSVTVAASTGESCSGVLSAGAGSCPLTFTTARSRTLTAKYPGDSNFKSSSSAAITQTVQK